MPLQSKEAIVNADSEKGYGILTNLVKMPLNLIRIWVESEAGKGSDFKFTLPKSVE